LNSSIFAPSHNQKLPRQATAVSLGWKAAVSQELNRYHGENTAARWKRLDSFDLLEI